MPKDAAGDPIGVPIAAGERVAIVTPPNYLTVNLASPGGRYYFILINHSSGTQSYGDGTDNRELPLQGVIEPDADGDQYGDESQDLCPTNASTHGACPPGSPQPTPPQTTPPPPNVRVADLRVREGDGGTRNASFAVRLSAASTQSVQVSFRTANGTARRRSDYRGRSGILVFAPGETVKRIVVKVIADRRDERNESFFLVLTNPVSAAIADARGRALIVDED